MSRGSEPDFACVAYPVRVGSRRRGDGGAAFESGDPSGRVIAILGAQPLARLVDVGVDRVLGDAELTADLL